MVVEKQRYLKQFAYVTLTCALAAICVILYSRENPSLRSLVTIPGVLSIIAFFYGIFMTITGIAIGWWGSIWKIYWLPYWMSNNIFIKTEHIDIKGYTFYSGIKVRVAGFAMILLGLAYICYKVLNSSSL